MSKSKKLLTVVISAFIGLSAAAPAAQSADPITKEACFNALRGNHYKAPDHDIGRFAENHFWYSWTGASYENYVKVNDYNAYGYVRFYNPIWPNTYTKHDTWGYCSRFSVNSIGDRIGTWPSTSG
jgi:hypothetical protein